MTLQRWMDDRQARGLYTFLRSEAVEGSGLSVEAVRKALQRLVQRGRLAKVKNYFFVIVPLEHRSALAPPASWFIHDLMNAMNLPYYVGLLSAAAMFGASHQQSQEFQVVTDRSVRSLSVGRSRIRFVASQFVSKIARKLIRTPTGSIQVSTPESTVVDLVRFAKIAGNLDNVATIIAELVPILRSRELSRAVKVSNDVPNAQRLGYILNQVGANPLSLPIHRWIERQNPRMISLRSGCNAPDSEPDERWHILVDQVLEVEV